MFVSDAGRSQGIGTAFVTAFLMVPAIYFYYGVIDTATPMPPMHARETLAAGAGAGVLWNLGNVGSILSLQPPLGESIGYPLTQAALIIGSCWGIFVFKEIRGQGPIRLFFAGALVTFVGMVMAAVGKSGG